jgi:hypothetical protein
MSYAGNQNDVTYNLANPEFDSSDAIDFDPGLQNETDLSPNNLINKSFSAINNAEQKYITGPLQNYFTGLEDAATQAVSNEASSAVQGLETLALYIAAGVLGYYLAAQLWDDIR